MSDARDQNACPSCGGKLLVPERAKQIYPRWRAWGATALLDDAQRVCAWCKAVKMCDGDWDRLKAKRDRARQLASLSSNSDKDVAHYKTALGELPETDSSDEEAGAAW